MRRMILAVMSITLCMICMPAYALDFSADMVSRSSGHNVSGKISVSGDKVRMDAAGASTISRMDKRVVWVLMPGQNSYMEQPFDPDQVTGTSERMPGELERVSMGMDAVDGVDAEKFRVVYTSKLGNATIFQWIEKRTGIPVKTAAQDGSWSVEYKNVSVGHQSPELFEIPAGRTKIEIPNMQEMLKGARNAVRDGSVSGASSD